MYSIFSLWTIRSVLTRNPHHTTPQHMILAPEAIWGGNIRGNICLFLKSTFILILAIIKGVEFKFGLSFFIFSSLLYSLSFDWLAYTIGSKSLSLSLPWRHSACVCVCFFLCLTLIRSKFGIWIRPCIVWLHYKWPVVTCGVWCSLKTRETCLYATQKRDISLSILF